MRIAELSRRAEVSVPTIKYYLREGLLQPGEFTSPNQARYSEAHVARLRLVRALLDIGGLSIATIQELLAALDAPQPDLHQLLGRALRTTAGPRGPVADDARHAALAEVDVLIHRQGWRVDPHSPAREALAEVIVAMRQLGMADLLALSDEYADAVARIAATDLKLVSARDTPAGTVQAAVVGTILGDPFLAALRRLAQEDASAKVFGGQPTEVKGHRRAGQPRVSEG